MGDFPWIQAQHICIEEMVHFFHVDRRFETPLKSAMIQIISGGQTGVDRAALKVGKQMNFPLGGWCPRSRRAEDGRISTEYPLTPTKSFQYTVRTLWNVRDADATWILYREINHVREGGTGLTVSYCEQLEKPYRCISILPESKAIELDKLGEDLRAWLKNHSVQILNIAGPRESKDPGIEKATEGFLKKIFSRCFGSG